MGVDATGGDAIVEMMPAHTEQELQRTIRNIHTVACHLLGEKNRKHLVVVGISPHSATTWTAHVEYEGFTAAETRTTIGEALGELLSSLVQRVATRLDEDARIVALLK